MKTLPAAADLCYKTFQVQDLQYPPPALGVYSFLDRLVYEAEGKGDRGKSKPKEPGVVRTFLGLITILQGVNTRSRFCQFWLSGCNTGHTSYNYLPSNCYADW